MAVNKRKVLDAARKFAQKGAKEKALKEYHVLLKLDPRDAKLHLEIGDAYRRWGQTEEAVAQYSRVADQYKADGFDARAVAVYKQILNLDPKCYSAQVSLSELYQRMGLDAEAVNALQAAADGYHKQGKKREALELLRKMAKLDPTNTTSRLKVAELLQQEGMSQDAVSEYEEVATELTRQGAMEPVTSVQERILGIAPDRIDVAVSLARNLIALQQPERAEPYAKRAVAADSGNADHYELLCEIYKSLRNDAAVAEVTRDLAKLYRERGDLDRAREVAQRIPSAMELDAGLDAGGSIGDETHEDEALLDEELLDEEFLAGDPTEAADAMAMASATGQEGAPEFELGVAESLSADLGEELVGEPLPRGEEGGEEALPEGDPDQLMAEASVYLRYGKRDQAMASLKAVLRQEPDHRAALEKLGEAHAEMGETEQAVEVWMRAADRARAQGDTEGLSILRDRVAALDPEAAETLVEAEALSEGEPAANPVEAQAPPPEIDVDLEVGVDIEAEAKHVGLTQSGDEAEPAADDIGLEVDIDLDEVADAGLLGDKDDREVPSREAGSPPSGGSSSGEPSTTSSQQVAEDLEEAEFYYQQALHSEAEAIYRRILAVAPNHPSALLRLGELAAARGEDPTAAGDSAEDPDTTAVSEVEEEFDSAIEVDVAGDTGVDVEVGVEGEEFEAGVGEGDVAGAGLQASEGDESEGAEAGEESTLPEVEIALEAEPDTPDEVESGGTAQTEPPAAVQADEAPPYAESPTQNFTLTGQAQTERGAFASDDFDLAAELQDVLAEEDAREAGTGAATGVLSTVEDGFASIFSEFKQGVSATLSEEDYETRYDLGIAYREMELYEDAIGEFRICLESEARHLDSLHMMGLCALDLGRWQDAVNHLEQALATADLPVEVRAGLYFDLGRSFQALGDVARARSAYESVATADSGFPGVDEKLAELDAGGPGAGTPSLAEDDAAFETFGDVIAEAEAEMESSEQESESFESFDDVITEVESAAAVSSSNVAPGTPPDPAADTDGGSDPDADSASQSNPRSRRKRKISFV